MAQQMCWAFPSPSIFCTSYVCPLPIKCSSARWGHFAFARLTSNTWNKVLRKCSNKEKIPPSLFIHPSIRPFLCSLAIPLPPILSSPQSVHSAALSLSLWPLSMSIREAQQCKRERERE